MLDYGAVFAFEIIYLHEARGFSLGVAGLVVGLVAAVAIGAPSFDRNLALCTGWI
jgi:hypothetical protein